MFTGIVEELGEVRRVLSGGRAGEIVIGASTVLEGTRVGDSIAVNGVCLTVTHLTESEFTADVMPETLRKSALGRLRTGDKVNLERALAANGRFGGHIVTGHIDGVGHVGEVRREQNAHVLSIEAAPAVMALIVEKGSVALDGVSLTVASATPSRFTVSIIPHTAAETSLLGKRSGDEVNIENDIIGKYVRKLVGERREEGLTLEYLQANGF